MPLVLDVRPDAAPCAAAAAAAGAARAVDAVDERARVERDEHLGSGTRALSCDVIGGHAMACDAHHLGSGTRVSSCDVIGGHAVACDAHHLVRALTRRAVVRPLLCQQLHRLKHAQRARAGKLLEVVDEEHDARPAVDVEEPVLVRWNSDFGNRESGFGLRNFGLSELATRDSEFGTTATATWCHVSSPRPRTVPGTHQSHSTPSTHPGTVSRTHDGHALFRRRMLISSSIDETSRTSLTRQRGIQCSSPCSDALLLSLSGD